jgi:hypothetical protein
MCSRPMVCDVLKLRGVFLETLTRELAISIAPHFFIAGQSRKVGFFIVGVLITEIDQCLKVLCEFRRIAAATLPNVNLS